MVRHIDVFQQLRKETEQQLNLIASLWEGYQEEENKVSPHRQRTATNRLLGYAFFLGIPAAKGSTGNRAIQALRRWQKSIGRLRDFDVSGDWIVKCSTSVDTPTANATAYILQQFKGQRGKILLDVRRDALGIPGADVRVQMYILADLLQKRLDALEAAPNEFHPENALRSVTEPWLAALEILRGNQADELLHAFRVKNKRLRFVLEILAEAGDDSELAHGVKRCAKITGQLHETLGTLSDLAVVSKKLRLLRAEQAAKNTDGFYQTKKKTLLKEMATLEQGRLKLEHEELNNWFRLWPTISAPDFLPASKRD